MAANSVTTAKMSVAQLSAISADMGTVTAGTVSANVIVAAQSFTANLATFTGDIDLYAGSTFPKVALYAQALTADGGITITSNDGETGDLFVASGGPLRITGELGVMVASSSSAVGFFGTSPVSRPTISAADSTSIIAALVSLGLVTT